MNCSCSRAIEPRQYPVQMFWPTLCSSLTKPLPKLWARWRRRKQPVNQRSQIKTRPSSDNWQASTLNNASQRLAGKPAVIACRHLLIRPGDVDHVMRDKLSFFERRLRRANLHPAIHSNRVAGDDLAVKLLGKMN